jgi:hypothetical protein
LDIPRDWLNQFAAYLHDFDRDYWRFTDPERGTLNIDEILGEIKRRASTLALVEGGEGTPLPAIEAHWGVTDCVAQALTLKLDKLRDLALYVSNKGQFKTKDWADTRDEFLGFCSKMAARKVPAAPLRDLLAGDPSPTTQALDSFATYRAARIKEQGFNPGPLQSKFPDPCAGRDFNFGPDPNAPYWPASELKAKYGIPPGRLRTAKRRGQLPFDIPPHTKRPRYSLPVARRLWPEDFEH